MNAELRQIWNLETIQKVPATYPAYGFEEDEVTPIFFENVPYQGKSTRAFAWYGFPEGASAENPAPGIVLVHGGGGTALADWCRNWIKMGYAVIAMDNCGGVPAWNVSAHYRAKWPRHEYSGPAGWGNIDKSLKSPEDQWIYHAVCTVLRAKELLASFPQVQKDNIGINGISWGAVLSCIAIGLDNSFSYAIPVYGCGGFNTLESSICKETDTPETLARWFELWDPDHYLTETTVPVLFLAGTNDVAFPCGNWFYSTTLPKGRVYRSLRPAYPHNHLISWESKTLNAFAQSCTVQEPLPEISSVRQDGKTLAAEFDQGNRKITSAKLYFTRASGAWKDCRWNELPAELNGNTVSAEIPAFTKTCYLGIIDEKDCLWTSELSFMD